MSEELPPSLFNILRQDQAESRREVNARFDGLARDMVTSALFTASQSAQKERDDRQDARIRELEQDKDARDAEIRKLLEEQRKSRAQLLTSLIVSGVTAILGLIGGITLWTIQTGLQSLVGGGG
jgi:biopolymer transport protein ExbB/TolQ